MNLLELKTKLLPVVAELWPHYKMTDERNGQTYGMLKFYVVDDLVRLVRADWNDHQDYPRWNAIRNRAYAERGSRHDEGRWVQSDEWELWSHIANEVKLMAKGEIPFNHDSIDEQWVIHNIIGKNPTQFEREDAQRCLERNASDSNSQHRTKPGDAMYYVPWHIEVPKRVRRLVTEATT